MTYNFSVKATYSPSNLAFFILITDPEPIMQVILSGRIAGTVILSGNIDAGLRAQRCVSWIFFKKNRLTCSIDTGLLVNIASRLTQDKMLLGGVLVGSLA